MGSHRGNRPRWWPGIGENFDVKYLPSFNRRRSYAYVAIHQTIGNMRHAWGGFHMDKAGLELEIGFGDFEHLTASVFTFWTPLTRRQGPNR